MRNKTLLTAFSILLSCLSGYAQRIPITPKAVKITANAIGKPTLSISFELDMGQNEINTDFWTNKNNRPKTSIAYADKRDTICKLTSRLEAFPNGMGIELSGFNEKTFDRFLNKDKDNQIKVVFDTDILIGLMPAEGQTVTWVIPADVANRMISEELTFTDEDRSNFLTSLNNFFYYENLVDFGVSPAQDSTKTDYVLTLKFQNIYNGKHLLSCNNDKKNTRFYLYWNVDSRLSTDFSDTLNYIKIYPVNLRWENFGHKVPFQFNVKLGNESSQDFVTKRASADASLNFIIPNLINLTTAKSNRLRLKPVINAGLKGYYDYSNDIDAFSSGQAFVNGHYYIPVFSNYAIIVDGGAFYDFSNERNPDNEIQGNYSVTLGAEIPKTGFKAMFKYVNGKTDINFRQASIISIGLLMDFFAEQKK